LLTQQQPTPSAAPPAHFQRGIRLCRLGQRQPAELLEPSCPPTRHSVTASGPRSELRELSTAPDYQPRAALSLSETTGEDISPTESLQLSRRPDSPQLVTRTRPHRTPNLKSPVNDPRIQVGQPASPDSNSTESEDSVLCPANRSVPPQSSTSRTELRKLHDAPDRGDTIESNYQASRHRPSAPKSLRPTPGTRLNSRESQSYALRRRAETTTVASHLD
jgi:hypothetical protein